jgi:FkbM family methyltransferase
MSNFFDKGVHYLGNKNQNVFVLNIGAMDGVLFDELIGYTNMYNFKGLYVEPIPYLFEKLKNNINGEGNLFENSAISNYNGEIEMVMIDQEVIDQGLVHSCFYGMSAVYPPKNGLGSEFDKPTVDKYGKRFLAKCITLDKLLRKHKIESYDIIKVDAEGHDYIIFEQIDFDEFRPKVVRLEWINLSQDEQDKIIKKFELNNYKYEISGQDIVGLPMEFYSLVFPDEQNNTNITEDFITSSEIENRNSSNSLDDLLNKLKNSFDKFSEDKRLDLINFLSSQLPDTNNNDLTFVTGLWNINRENLTEGWSRSYEHYLSKFAELLKIENNLIIFGDSELETFVWNHRKKGNTQFIKRDLDWFKYSVPYDKIQEIRNNHEWYSQSGWLPDSTQAKLDMYNPLVMSKMFLLHDAKILDQFDSKHMYWIDAGITNTIHQGYFTHDRIQNKFHEIFSKFGFISFPYQAVNEIHGFTYPKINQYAGKNVKLVARGGLFGGPKETITDVNNIYYNTLNQTLNDGFMGTEESIFSIMLYKHPDLIDYVEIEDNGLIGKFCEDVKNDTYVVKNTSGLVSSNSKLNSSNTGLYVISFNSPKQFETLVESMRQYDENFLTKPKKFLLDNSTDLSTTPRYQELCEIHGFEHIKKDNLGICGGRQWIAEHFDKTGLDFMFFFEDDMFFYPKKGEVCKNGFNRFADNFYNSVLDITKKYDYDYLKFNYTEFFGDNGTQWAWYNVPQDFRENHWPEKPTLPVSGIDPNAPRTQFKNIRSYNGIPFIDGEIYFCNWPQVITKQGNKKIFLTTTWAHPYEQTWMSYVFQETIKGELNMGMLLMSPTEHDRFEHYEAGLRREN